MCGGGHEMRAGVHCAHVEMRKLNDGEAMVGVAGPGFGPAAGGGMAFQSAEGWVMDHRDGNLRHNGGDEAWAKEGKIGVKAGDVVVRRPPCASPRRSCSGTAPSCRRP